MARLCTARHLSTSSGLVLRFELQHSSAEAYSSFQNSFVPPQGYSPTQSSLHFNKSHLINQTCIEEGEFEVLGASVEGRVVAISVGDFRAKRQRKDRNEVMSACS